MVTKETVDSKTGGKAPDIALEAAKQNESLNIEACLFAVDKRTSTVAVAIDGLSNISLSSTLKLWFKPVSELTILPAVILLCSFPNVTLAIS